MNRSARRLWLGLAAALLGGAGLLVVGVDRVGATFPTGVNGRLAFAAGPGGADQDVYTANVNGSGVVQLPDGGDDREPIWSPDGAKIAYVNDDDGDWEIWVRNADGTGSATKLTDNGSDDRHPSWEPNGNRIAYTAFGGGDKEIMVMSAVNGSGKVALTDNAFDDQQPNWEPNGDRIAFASDRGRAGDLDIYLMDDDGVPVSLPLTTASGEDNMPSWSPDGSKIAFVSKRGGNYDVYVMDNDGSDLQPPLTTDPADDRDPAWSPDGTKIAFDSDRQGPQRVFLMDADGNNETVFASGLQESRTPEWQRLTSAPTPPPQPTPTQCADGQDNDGDGKTDLADPGCANAGDTSESPDPFVPLPAAPTPTALQQRVLNSTVKVSPHGTYVTVYFKTLLATKKVRAELWTGYKSVAGAKLRRLTLASFPTAKKTWLVRLTNLVPRRSSKLYITATHPLAVGTTLEYRHPTNVKTKQRNVSVHFKDVHVIDDGDDTDCGDFDGGGSLQFGIQTVGGASLAHGFFHTTACTGDKFSINKVLVRKNVAADQVVARAWAVDEDCCEGFLGQDSYDTSTGRKTLDLAPIGFNEFRHGSTVITTNEGDPVPRLKFFISYQVVYVSW